MSEFENSIVNVRTLQEFINTKDVNDAFKSGKNPSKESFLTLSFSNELTELSFKNVRFLFRLISYSLRL